MKLKPLGTSVVIRLAENRNEIKDVGGILLTESIGETRKAIITEIGSDVKESELKVGIAVLIPDGELIEIDVRGDKRYLIDELDIIAIIEE